MVGLLQMQLKNVKVQIKNTQLQKYLILFISFAMDTQSYLAITFFIGISNQTMF
jgi:hypothetical protein